MRSERILLLVFAVVLCGSAVAQLTSDVIVSAAGENDKTICSENGHPETNCSGSYSFVDSNQDIDFLGSASTTAAYGPIKATMYSSVYNYGFTTDYPATAMAEGYADSFDTIYIYGLADGEVAYLRGFFPALTTPTGSGPWPFSYSINIQQAANVYDCVVNSTNPPNCSLKILVTYSGGQPVPLELMRQLTSNAIASLAAGVPNGAYVFSGLQISAETNFKVVNAKGAIIPGVTVVGASGYIYN